ncbi:MAG: hypothetical protein COB50_04115 [Thiotrichales bacterium]|nr:MAG: hypothetical protein COB50_04115 [Thiotrichales bacterium]
MSHETKKTGNATNTIFAAGAAISLGAFSFAGTFLVSASIPLAALAFFLSSVIEGEVYRQNIDSSLNRFQKDSIQKNIIFNILAKRINQYLDAKAETEKKTEAVELNDDNEEKVEICEKMKAVELLKDQYFNASAESKTEAEKDIIDYLYKNENDTELTDIQKAVALFLKDDRDKIQTAIETVKARDNWIMLAAIVSGLVFSIASITALNLCTTQIAGLSLFALPWYASLLVTSFVFFAFIGESLIMYNTLMKASIDRKVHVIYKTGNSEEKTDKTKLLSAKNLVIMLIVALAIFSTVAAASTYFIALLKSIEFLIAGKGITSTMAPEIFYGAIVPVLIYSMAKLVFHISNALETSRMFSEMDSSIISKNFKKFKEQRTLYIKRTM